MGHLDIGKVKITLIAFLVIPSMFVLVIAQAGSDGVWRGQYYESDNPPPDDYLVIN